MRYLITIGISQAGHFYEDAVAAYAAEGMSKSPVAANRVVRVIDLYTDEITHEYRNGEAQA